ncbi:hypothetical protein ACS5PU_16515 [Pedobacter sp. GSP4]|uniref:hypothetical protein n=1 Tax=Pedobacter sp. GSP4 TaxID=3453716 RepID=UPI003EEEB9C0
MQVNFFEVFNTREIAYLIWGAIVCFIFLFLKSLRKDFLPVLKSLVGRDFVRVYFFTIIYVSFCSFILSRIGLWHTSMVKDTIVWGIFAALPMMYSIMQAKNLKRYFGSTLKDLFQITIVLEFVLGLYTFSLWVELLIVPFTLMLGALIAFSGKDEKNQKVTKLFKWISNALGLFLIVEVVGHIVGHFGEYWRVSYFKQFLLPLTLSVMFIPFLYLLVCFARFQETFVVLKIRIKSPKHLLYTKRILFFSFFNNIEGLNRWRQHVFRGSYQNRTAIWQSVREIKEAQKREEKPALVSIEDGWSPYIAKDFLTGEGMSMGFYSDLGGGEWGVISDPKRVNGSGSGINSTYSVFGTKLVATSLKLRLEVADEFSVGDADFLFARLTEVLYLKVFGRDIPLDIYANVILHKPSVFEEGFARVIIDISYYGNHLNGYSLKFSVIHREHVELY